MSMLVNPFMLLGVGGGGGGGLSVVGSDLAVYTSGTVRAVSIPGSPSTGDLLLVFYTHDDDDDVTSGDLTDMTGTVDLGVDEWYSGYRILDGTEGGSVELTAAFGDEGKSFAIVISGWNDTGTIADGLEWVANGDGFSMNPPSLSPAWGSAECVWIGTGQQASAPRAVTSLSSPWDTNHVYDDGTTPSFAATWTIDTASSQDPPELGTGGDSSNYQMTVAVKSA